MPMSIYQWYKGEKIKLRSTNILYLLDAKYNGVRSFGKYDISLMTFGVDRI